MSFTNWCQIMAGFAVIPGLTGFYSFHSFLFPYYLRTKKSLHLLLLSVVVAGIATLAGMLLLTLQFNTTYLENDGISGVIAIAIPVAFIALVNGAAGFVIRGFEAWFHDIKLKAELNHKNYQMELALIKSQIDPHFLFNTINNIDILIEKDSIKASAYLNKLSDIMRFMLYETKTNSILLTKELAYIEKYIALQKVRTSNVNAINCIIQGDPGSKMIAPMLFIPFIENAFKHTNLTIDGAVKIIFVIGKKMVMFECENLIEQTPQPEEQSGGLGKELMERRLALLYPAKHHLLTTFGDHHYRVKLTVEA
ncbi:Histidine kinase [Dyadobacter psychrophilus]|uniref:Histidine kinase n=2 Tax=Dyadobacter psychrophilus TaxID=651661 RepID=A0A1T5E208_9BACT|nr:Histidine kinase [Dyadobacter psychrophilus]